MKIKHRHIQKKSHCGSGPSGRQVLLCEIYNILQINYWKELDNSHSVGLSLYCLYWNGIIGSLAERKKLLDTFDIIYMSNLLNGSSSCRSKTLTQQSLCRWWNAFLLDLWADLWTVFCVDVLSVEFPSSSTPWQCSTHRLSSLIICTLLVSSSFLRFYSKVWNFLPYFKAVMLRWNQAEVTAATKKDCDMRVIWTTK